jgi:hypothetical protein
MVTYRNAYHSVINIGPNKADARNFAEPDWLVEPLYTECSKRRGCGDHGHMTVAGMEIGEYHPLSIKDFEEPKEPVGDEKYKAKARKKRSYSTKSSSVCWYTYLTSSTTSGTLSSNKENRDRVSRSFCQVSCCSGSIRYRSEKA